MLFSAAKVKVLLQMHKTFSTKKVLQDNFHDLKTTFTAHNNYGVCC